eukprot:c3960_g1_i1.p1 GENE.c3960_g1_i1~~c3960_g1_i1.p1  ORF type:complete len:119 (+),score=20.86 c3960_g1_i1:40-396(+)
MSWVGYIDNLLKTGHMDSAAIILHNGNVVENRGIMQPDELAAIPKAFTSGASVVTLGGQQLHVIKDELSMKMSKGNFTACVYPTTQFYLVGLSSTKSSANLLCNDLGRVGDYLTKNNF